VNFNKYDIVHVKDKGNKKIGVILEKHEDQKLLVCTDKTIYKVLVDNKITTYLNYHFSKV
jgi:hypothetical protein